jgi:5-formyltetrahydrofolate cyclo-ligase
LVLSLREQKKSLRAEAREKRSANRDINEDCADKLADVFLLHFSLPPGAVVVTYAPIRDEIDPSALNESLRAKGYPLALPIIIGENKSLIFRAYEKGDKLLANPLGIFEPMSSAAGVEPDVLLIPMLAFDRARNRLGYGGGYYDRTIKKLRAKKPILTIGLAYSYQEVDKIPIGTHDVPVDKIVTELGTF